MSAETFNITKYWMALSSVRGIGPKTLRMLVNRFGSPDKVITAPISEIAGLPRLNTALAREISGIRCKLKGFQNFIHQLSEMDIEVLCPDSDEYPGLLKLIEDFPPILYRSGRYSAKNTNTVAIVGTRYPSLEGLEAASMMAWRLSGMGFTIVSGLAIGIDAAAHSGALEAGGKTLAVLGSGLKKVYPRENRELANSIYNNGSILSECHPHEIVSRQKLVSRNRIISGMSLGTILVEPRKGALNAALSASKQGRHIFVYETETHNILPKSLSETASVIREPDELDFVVNQLQMAKEVRGQMQLL